MHTLFCFIPTIFSLIFLTSSVLGQDAIIAVDEKFWSKDVDQLSVHVSDADVTVNTKAGRSITVQILVDGRNSKEAMDYFENQNFSVALDKATLVVESNPENIYGISYDWRNSADIYVEIEMPANIPLKLRTLDGNFDVNELTAGAEIKTSDGHIKVGSVSGDKVAIQTLDGNIDAQSLMGQSISVKTSDGDISVGSCSGEKITIQTIDGDIDAQTINSLSISVKTSDGDLNLGALEGDSVKLQTMDGDILIESAAGKINIKTSDGDIALRELLSSGSQLQVMDGDIVVDKVTGSLSLRSSDGDVLLGLIEPENVSVSVHDGDVALAMPQDVSATLDLSGSEVSMDEFPHFIGTITDTGIDGDLNGGGPVIHVRTSDGDVLLRNGVESGSDLFSR